MLLSGLRRVQNAGRKGNLEPCRLTYTILSENSDTRGSQYKLNRTAFQKMRGPSLFCQDHGQELALGNTREQKGTHGSIHRNREGDRKFVMIGKIDDTLGGR